MTLHQKSVGIPVGPHNNVLTYCSQNYRVIPLRLFSKSYNFNKIFLKVFRDLKVYLRISFYLTLCHNHVIKYCPEKENNVDTVGRRTKIQTLVFSPFVRCWFLCPPILPNTSRAGVALCKASVMYLGLQACMCVCVCMHIRVCMCVRVSGVRDGVGVLWAVVKEVWDQGASVFGLWWWPSLEVRTAVFSLSSPMVQEAGGSLESLL